MSVKFISLLLVVAVTLAGCESRIHKAGPPPPPMEVTPGSTFTVVKDFLIPSGDSSVYFQDARLYPQGDIQPDDPYCEFSAGAATAAGAVIKTGVFTVSDVTYDEAGVGVGGVDISVSGYRLQEAASGKTYRMDCMLPLLSRGARFVTPAEIQSAVGGYMELKVAP
jgi:predicted small secreted protein